MPPVVLRLSLSPLLPPRPLRCGHASWPDCDKGNSRADNCDKESEAACTKHRLGRNVFVTPDMFRAPKIANESSRDQVASEAHPYGCASKYDILVFHALPSLYCWLGCTIYSVTLLKFMWLSTSPSATVPTARHVPASRHARGAAAIRSASHPWIVSSESQCGSKTENHNRNNFFHRAPYSLSWDSNLNLTPQTQVWM